MKVDDVLKVNDLDRSIWDEELNEFVPSRLWDMHNHLSLERFDLDPKKSQADHYNLSSGDLEKVGTMEVLQACNAVLFPGREVTPFVLPNPYQYCDCAGINEWAAAEVRKRPGAACTMVVQPKMTAEEIDGCIQQHRFVGYKPYMWYASIENWRECRITDMLPEYQLEVADRYGLIMALHLSKRAAIGDAQNLDDLERLAARYRRVRWLLLHNARSYYDRPIEKAAARLKNIPNVWLESSSVCEAAAFYATFTNLDLTRFCYGSDDLPVGVTRGKYITWGHAWTQLDENTKGMKTPHCDGRMTFVRYEMLRAMKRAAQYAGLTRQQIEDIFCNNATKLVEAVRNDLDHVLGPRTEG